MDNAIHHSKDSKGTNAVVLCQLSTFDVYTMLHPFRDAPTEYVFALRAQEKPRVFERSEDYMKMFSAEDADSLREWVLSIRCSKVRDNNTISYRLDSDDLLKECRVLSTTSKSCHQSTIAYRP